MDTFDDRAYYKDPTTIFGSETATAANLAGVDPNFGTGTLSDPIYAALLGPSGASYVPAFEECLNSGKHSKAIRAAMKEASKVGITGTPGFVLALTDSKDPNKATGLTFLRGAQPFPRFKSEIDQALSSAK